MSRLGILVNTDRHLKHVQGFTRAALAAKHEVIIFVMDGGTRLLRDAGLQGLAGLPGVSLSLCDHSAKRHGVDLEGLPAAVVCGSQLNNAMMNHQAERVIVLQAGWFLEGRQMHVLHLLNDGPEAACAGLLRLKSTELEVEVIDLSQADVDYGKLIEKIFASDKVISW